MAYFIFHSDGTLHSIAATEADKNSLPITNHYVVKEVTDNDFNRVKKQTAGASVSGDTVTVTDFEHVEDPNIYNDEASLQSYHSNVIFKIDQFISAGNEDKSLYGAISSYKTLLEGFDTSTITYPMTKTWEEYCEDNSITYVSPLQIP
tara:strand:- start:1096 stop:1539 length:444 start_codon:yes stop_codon:yes gene_type:complete